MSQQHNIELYTLAIEGLQARVDHFNNQIAHYRDTIELLSGVKKRGRPRKLRPEVYPDDAAEPKPIRKRRKMSPESRANIAAAQKKRWAKFRKEQKTNAKAAA